MSNSNHHGHDGCCSHSATAPSVHQTLQEMEFERGVWSAAMDGELQKVKDYLRKGGHVDATDSAGYTALHYASRNGQYSVCELLLIHGANPNCQTRSGGMTALHRAAYCGHKNIVELLIRHSCDATLCDSDGRNALHKAAERGHRDCAELILQYQPSLVNMKDKRGKYPVQYVCNNDNALKDMLQTENEDIDAGT